MRKLWPVLLLIIQASIMELAEQVICVYISLHNFPAGYSFTSLIHTRVYDTFNRSVRRIYPVFNLKKNRKGNTKENGVANKDRTLAKSQWEK